MRLDAQRLDLIRGCAVQGLRRGDVLRDDLDHVHVGDELVQQPLQRDQRAGHRGHRARYLDAVPLRQLGQRGHERGQVQVLQVHGAVFGHNGVQIGQQRRIVGRIGLSAGESQQAVGERRRVLFGHGEDHLLEHRTGFGVEPAGHAQVDQDDLSAGDDDVAGMRIGVEEAVVEHLGGVVVDELGTDLLQVVSGGDQLFGVRDGDALHIVHHHHMLGAQIHVGFRAVHVDVGLAEAFELGQIAGLHEEVRLGFEGIPELLDHTAQVHHLRTGHDAGGQTGDRTHDGYVLGHGLTHAGALHLDGHVLAGEQCGPMHLGQRCGTQRGGVDVLEDLADGASVFRGQRLQDGLVRHWVGVGA